MNNKHLPIDVQNFERLITGNHVYVDKTQLLYQLITQGSVYFLSRPRRFGKSLLISTLDAIFQNKQHLFEGLWIVNSDYAWQDYPVIWLDMSAVANDFPQKLEQSLHHHLQSIAKQYSVSLETNLTLSDAFRDLILQLAKEQKVVVLIDEYDKPLLDQIHHPDIALQNREILKHFYGILKSQDAHIRFVLLTGVSKFSKVSVFSGLNNLEDISMSSDYATLLGYTQKELEFYFAPWIKKLAVEQEETPKKILDKIKHWYNGYRFSNKESQVYNPFSTLLLFKQQEFSTHWFASGTPTFLVNLIRTQDYDVRRLENLEVKESAFAVYEIDRLDVLPLLYQTGYLTIRSYEKDFNTYTLGYPNYEVEQSFVESLLTEFSQLKPSVQNRYLVQLARALVAEDFRQFFTLLKQFLAQIPYDLHLQHEHYYHTIFYLLLTALGLTIDAEVHTAFGRIDAVIEWQDKVYIFEFKLDKSAQEAMQQIKEKQYAEKYATEKKIIYLIGVNFSTQERNVQEWLIEKK